MLWIVYGATGLTGQPTEYCLTLDQRNNVLVQLLELDTIKMIVLPALDSMANQYQMAYESCTTATTATQAALMASQQQVQGVGMALRLTQERVATLESQAKRSRWAGVKRVLITAMASLGVGLAIGILAH